jgi:hypothetical protein
VGCRPLAGRPRAQAGAGATEAPTAAPAAAPSEHQYEAPQQDFQHVVSAEQFRSMGYQVVDLIADYYSGLEQVSVKPQVQARGGAGWPPAWLQGHAAWLQAAWLAWPA